MAQFPLALAIEPRLLPLAVTNGFSMDSKVCGNHICSESSLTVTIVSIEILFSEKCSRNLL